MKVLLIMLLLIPTIVFSNIELTENNHVLFKGVVNAKSVAEASRALLKLSFKTKPGDKIYLVIDSPGGSIIDGLDFVQLFISIPRDVECVAIKAHSMAHHFLQACPGKRFGIRNMVSMAHRASGTFEGSFNKGEIEDQLEFWTGIVQSMEQVNADRMKLTLEEYQAKAKDEYWCHGKSCIKKNFVDEITQVTCSKELIESSTTETVHTFFGRFTVSYSKCPLLRYGEVSVAQ